MTEELRELILRSEAAIREARRLLDANSQLRTYIADVLAQMRRQVHFRPDGKIYYPSDLRDDGERGVRVE